MVGLRIGLVLVLMCLPALTGCISSPARTAKPTPALPAAEVRMRDWVLDRAADFAAGQMAGLVVTDEAGGELRLSPVAGSGVYTSTIVVADFSFNAIAPHWAARLPSGGQLRVEIRFRSGQADWVEWQPVGNAEWNPLKEQFHPETPFLLSSGTHIQCRVTITATDSAASPVLEQLTLTYMDTTVGPTTQQAQTVRQMAQTTMLGAPSPAIIPRAGWGCDERYRTWSSEYRPVAKIVVHHTVTPNDYNEASATQWVRAIYYYHAVTLGWGDIGYNYLIDRFGNVYEGRYGGPGVVGGHVYSYNYGSMGVALIGTYGNSGGSVAPTQPVLSALTALGAWEASRSFIHPLESASFYNAAPPNLGGHRDYPPFSTTCPGDLLYAQLPGVRQAVWSQMMSFLSPFRVQWEARSGTPDPVQPRQTISLAVNVRNVGWQTWLQGGSNPVRIGYHWLDAAGRAVVQPPQDDLRAALAQDVSFGRTHEWAAVRVTAPITPGLYTLALDMVQEGVAWFHDANPSSPLLSIPVTVAAPPTPTPAPTLDPATLKNGGFEYDGAWTIYETAYPARYVGTPRRSGNRALQTGIADPAANVFSYSSVEQAVVLPGGGNVQLTWWYQAQVSSGDYGYVYINPAGRGWQVLQVMRSGVSDWTQVSYDLTAWAGLPVSIRVGTYNNGSGGVSVMYVDDMSIQAIAAVPTATPTLTPTATPTPTPTILPTSTSAACAELVVNGDFEANTGWTIAQTPYRARYTTAAARTGSRAMQVGIADLAENQMSYSSADQRMGVPAGRRATLTLWYWMPRSGGIGDYGYLMIQPDGSDWRTLRVIKDATGGWTQLQVDVSHYAGSAFTLRLGARNDGSGDGAAAVMYVDGVSVQSCP